MQVYNFNYSDLECEISFIVDPEVFTVSKAIELREFGWPIPEGNEISQAIGVHALECVREGLLDKSIEEIKQSFENKEGFWLIDGTDGILLNHISGVELEFEGLTYQVSEL